MRNSSHSSKRGFSMKSRIGLMILAAAMFIIPTGALASSAGATAPPEHLVTICHATPPDTAAQGYVQLTVDVASVGYQHSGHQDQHDADIIPPYSYGDYSFAGKNWDAASQAIYNNGCQPVTPPPPTQPPTNNCPPGTELSVPDTCGSATSTVKPQAPTPVVTPPGFTG